MPDISDFHNQNIGREEIDIENSKKSYVDNLYSLNPSQNSSSSYQKN